jgi:hypothetical protein
MRKIRIRLRRAEKKCPGAARGENDQAEIVDNMETVIDFACV